MIRVSNIKVSLDELLEEKIIKKLKTKDKIEYKINKKSLDARDKKNIHYVYQVDVTVKNEKKYLKNKDIIKTPNEKYIFPKTGTKKLNSRPVIIGTGPSGLFCGYLLAINGYKPLIIERGDITKNRIEKVEKFWKTNILDENTNVQFGEGGAGTFSDGKLNTLIKDKNYRMKKVFETFVEFGAPKEIMYENKPHIGTDNLRKIIPKITNKIKQLGGEIKYNTKLTDIIIKEGKISQIVLNDKEKITCDILVLALGHSASDTFEMLCKRGLNIENKPFAIGIRLQHQQNQINKAQYGDNNLPPATYKLTYNTNNRGIYSFCMCPGGYVVNSSSDNKHLVINGMSNYKRESQNANSAIIVTVNEEDFGKNPLDSIKYQRQIEKKAYEICKGNIPVQLYKDYKENKKSKEFKNIKPVFKGNYEFANINDILPDYINNSLKEAIDYFGTKIKGFNDDNVIIAGVETRTSSPIRIKRDDNYMSNIKGIYPIGEGAGYSGGITSSAIDGIKIAEAIAQIYKESSNV